MAYNTRYFPRTPSSSASQQSTEPRSRSPAAPRGHSHEHLRHHPNARCSVGSSRWPAHQYPAEPEPDSPPAVLRPINQSPFFCSKKKINQSINRRSRATPRIWPSSAPPLYRPRSTRRDEASPSPVPVPPRPSTRLLPTPPFPPTPASPPTRVGGINPPHAHIRRHARIPPPQSRSRQALLLPPRGGPDPRPRPFSSPSSARRPPPADHGARSRRRSPPVPVAVGGAGAVRRAAFRRRGDGI